MEVQRRNNDKEIYAPLKDKWLVMKPEEEVRQRYICRLVDSYGYDLIDKIVFLFDYDDGGWKDGWKKIKAIHDVNPKIIPIFYQDSYSSNIYPTSDDDVKKVNGSECIKSENSFMVEDLFSESSYASLISQVISARRHKDFRKLPFGKKGTAGAIKDYIEKQYNSFNDTWYDGFKPVLDNLLNVFYL